MNFISQTLITTPLWGWIVLIVLIILGVLDFKDGKKSLFVLGIAPVVFLFLSIISWASMESYYIYSVIIGYIVGASMGVFWAVHSMKDWKWDSKKRFSIFMPGTKMFLIIFVAAFVMGYIAKATLKLPLYYDQQVVQWWHVYGASLIFFGQSINAGVVIFQYVMIVLLTMKQSKRLNND